MCQDDRRLCKRALQGVFSQGELLLFYGVGFLITCTFDNDAFHAAAINTRAINTGATDEGLRCSLDR